MNRLFDFEEEEEFDDEDFDTPTEPKRDKIFNNDFNIGNLDYERFDHLPQIDQTYTDNLLGECYNSYEFARKQRLEVLIDDYVKNTKHVELLDSNKKIPKRILPLIYEAIVKQFKDGEFTSSERFIAIAEYFSIKYEILYENIPSLYREDLVRELDETYEILKRKGLKRLF